MSGNFYNGYHDFSSISSKSSYQNNSNNSKWKTNLGNQQNSIIRNIETISNKNRNNNLFDTSNYPYYKNTPSTYKYSNNNYDFQTSQYGINQNKSSNL